MRDSYTKIAETSVCLSVSGGFRSRRGEHRPPVL